VTSAARRTGSSRRRVGYAARAGDLVV